MWLMQNRKLSRAKAYDQARKEFYDYRYKEAVTRRVAIEEALMNGAYFGKTAMEIGMKLEDEAFEDWKKWATAQAELSRQAAAAAYTGMDVEEWGSVQVEEESETPAETN